MVKRHLALRTKKAKLDNAVQRIIKAAKDRQFKGFEAKAQKVEPNQDGINDDGDWLLAAINASSITAPGWAEGDMFANHWSDCALHNGPARWPMPCDCGGIKADTRSKQSFWRLRSWIQLWQARSVWLRESHKSPYRRLLRTARQLRLWTSI